MLALEAVITATTPETSIFSKLCYPLAMPRKMWKTLLCSFHYSLIFHFLRINFDCHSVLRLDYRALTGMKGMKTDGRLEMDIGTGERGDLLLDHDYNEQLSSRFDLLCCSRFLLIEFNNESGKFFPSTRRRRQVDKIYPVNKIVVE